MNLPNWLKKNFYVNDIRWDEVESPEGLFVGGTCGICKYLEQGEYPIEGFGFCTKRRGSIWARNDGCIKWEREHVE